MTEQSPSIAGLAAALVAAQADLTNPPKDSVNPHFKSKFADLATVRGVVVPAFRTHGLAVTQLLTSLDGKPAIATQLVHTSGEWLRCTSPLVPVKQDPQGYGAALTYARRYALQAIAGVCADDDDDGNHASAAGRPAQQQQKPQQQQRPQQSAPAAQAAGKSAAAKATPADIRNLARDCAEFTGTGVNAVLGELYAAFQFPLCKIDDLDAAKLEASRAWLSEYLANLTAPDA